MTKCVATSPRIRSNTHQLRRPLQIPLPHQPAHPPIPRRIRDQKPAITNMTAAPRIIRLDIKAPQTLPRPILPLHPPDLVDAPDLAEQHDGAEVLEPVGPEGGKGHGRDHRVGVALFDLAVELVAEVGEERGGDVRGGGEGEQGGDGDAVAERDGAGDDVGRELRVAGWGRVGGCAGGAVDGGGGWVVEHGGHGGLFRLLFRFFFFFFFFFSLICREIRD